MNNSLAICFVLILSSALYVSAGSEPELEDITGYDGIVFGTLASEVPSVLDKLFGVNRDQTGKAVFEMVPAKTYFRYYVNRSADGKDDQSEVAVAMRNETVNAFKDVFGGDWVWDKNKADKFYQDKLRELTTKWGKPQQEALGKVIWVGKAGKALLEYERPSNNVALPIIKLTVIRK